MRFTVQVRRVIYDKTDGHCHICHCRVALTNYGRVGERGAWEVEHSVPKAKGGTDHLNNLLPACIPCNRGKGYVSTRTARRWSSKARAPFSKETRQVIRQDNTVAGGLIGGLLGLAAGPVGLAIGAALGAALGNDLKVPKV